MESKIWGIKSTNTTKEDVLKFKKRQEKMETRHLELYWLTNMETFY